MNKRPLTVGSLKNNLTFTASTEKVENIKKANIKIAQNHVIFDVEPEQHRTLLDCALDQNQTIEYKCRKGNCGRCEVLVIEGNVLLQPISEKEKIKLGNKAMKGYRLACQTFIR